MSTNPYLQKILAEQARKEERDKDIATVGQAAAGAGVAAGTVSHQLSRGNVTGRETFYHGSSKSNIEKIKKSGIVPQASSGISKMVGEDLQKANEGLVFADRRPSVARMYSRQQELLEKSKNSLEFALRREEAANPFKPSHVVKVNIPTWKDQFSPQRNPELDTIKKKPMSDTQRKAFEETLGPKNVHTNKGTIPPEFIKESPKYKPNSWSEVKDFASKNKGRFAKGVGTSIAGVAVGAGITAHAIKSWVDRHDNSGK